jgi:uncharacterized membrane protein
MNKIKKLVLFLILVSFGIAFYYYPTMPDMMASHWGFNGEVNGYMTKFWGLFLLPILSLGLFLLFLLIPKIDPLRENVVKFIKYFDRFILVMELFLFYIYILTILWNRGLQFNISGILTPALGLLFFYMGVLMENARPNWFIGIRTPWTLSSENVWNKTHKLGGKLYKASGIIALLGVFAGDLSIFFVLIPIILVSFYLTIYSYVEYGKEKSQNSK